MIKGNLILLQLILSMTGVMAAEDWQDQYVLHINTVPPHSSVVYMHRI